MWQPVIRVRRDRCESAGQYRPERFLAIAGTPNRSDALIALAKMSACERALRSETGQVFGRYQFSYKVTKRSSDGR